MGNVVYVLCPAYHKSGGSELLHQLVYVLNQNGRTSRIVYYNIVPTNENVTAPDFEKYVDGYVTFDDIPDSPSSEIIFYEGSSRFFNKKHKARNIMWWLSVDFYFRYNTLRIDTSRKNFLYPIFDYIRYKKWRVTIAKIDQLVERNLAQSYYAMNFLEKNDVNNIYYLSDYISDEYLKLYDQKYSNKRSIVLYNPKKGYRFTKKLIKHYPELNWIPIENLSTKGVKELMLKAKVYIDFGFHPGKDRIPREAAMAGCCVITNRRGSAAFQEDVPIPETYKFDDKVNNLEKIHEKIVYCLSNYSDAAKDFYPYRKYILQEKEKFIEDVKKIFL